MRGKLVAAASPALRAAGFEARSTSTTRTPGTARATAAVSSVQPLAATTTSNSPGSAPSSRWRSVRPMTVASLCAATTMLTTARAR